jgi:hypothetical protein
MTISAGIPKFFQPAEEFNEPGSYFNTVELNL